MSEIVNNRYRLLEKRGSGGTAEVYEAFDLRLKRKVALKRVRRDARGRREEGARRLLREAEHLARSAHPNVVAIHDVLELEDSVCLILELVEGVPFRELHKRGPVAEAELLPYLGQLLSALERVHAARIAHRDVNPKNILVTPEGVVKLTDFGLSASFDDPEPRAGGTIGYMAPEALRHRGQVGPGVDIWGAGIVAYQALLGTPEFRKLYGAVEPVAWARWLLSREKFRTLDELSAPVSPGLSAIVERMLEKDPRARYASIAEIRRDFERLAAPPAAEEGPSLASAVRRLLPSLLARPGRKP